MHSSRCGSHFFSGWGLLLFSCTFFMLFFPAVSEKKNCSSNRVPLVFLVFFFFSQTPCFVRLLLCQTKFFFFLAASCFFFFWNGSSASQNRADRLHARACITCQSGASSADTICVRPTSREHALLPWQHTLLCSCSRHLHYAFFCVLVGCSLQTARRSRVFLPPEKVGPPRASLELSIDPV